MTFNCRRRSRFHPADPLGYAGPMRNPLPSLAWALGLLVVLSGCGYNTIQTADEAVKAAWGEVQNQYQRRMDLIPNLVATVKGARAPPR